MAIRDGEKHKAFLGPPLCGSATREKARRKIEIMAKAGHLGPIPGWEGDLAEGYADILGLSPSDSS